MYFDMACFKPDVLMFKAAHLLFRATYGESVSRIVCRSTTQLVSTGDHEAISVTKLLVLDDAWPLSFVGSSWSNSILRLDLTHSVVAH